MNIDDFKKYDHTIFETSQKNAYKMMITDIIAPNALDHKVKRMDKLDKEEDGFLDKISSSQRQFLNDFEAYAKGDWVDAAKREMEAVKKELDTIK